MRRRDFVTGIAGSAVALPLAAHAQQPTIPVIGFLYPTSPDTIADRLRGFRQGLKETGYVGGENVTIEYRWAEGQFDRLPVLAAELAHQRPDCQDARPHRAALAARRRRRGDRITTPCASFAAVHESVNGRFCCKTLFAPVIKNFPGRRRDFRVKMRGTSSPDDKLMGDLPNEIEATQIGGFRSDRVIAGKLAPGSFGVLQQYRHYPGICCGAAMRPESGTERTCSVTRTFSVSLEPR
jgi:hypothetical protein